MSYAKNAAKSAKASLGLSDQTTFFPTRKNSADRGAAKGHFSTPPGLRPRREPGAGSFVKVKRLEPRHSR